MVFHIITFDIIPRNSHGGTDTHTHTCISKDLLCSSHIPRSTIIGLIPASTSSNAAKRPAGPAPTTPTDGRTPIGVSAAPKPELDSKTGEAQQGAEEDVSPSGDGSSLP